MTRNWNGKPETPAGTRFYDLRASGCRGPIDQDGYCIDDEDRSLSLLLTRK